MGIGKDAARVVSLPVKAVRAVARVLTTPLRANRERRTGQHK